MPLRPLGGVLAAQPLHPLGALLAVSALPTALRPPQPPDAFLDAGYPWLPGIIYSLHILKPIQRLLAVYPPYLPHDALLNSHTSAEYLSRSRPLDTDCSMSCGILGDLLAIRIQIRILGDSDGLTMFRRSKRID